MRAGISYRSIPVITVLLLLAAAGIAFTIEKSKVRNGVEVTGHVIAKRRIPHPVGPYGDAYEVIIEYRVKGQPKRLITTRAVWDTIGKRPLNTIGAAVQVLHLPDGRAVINRFYYLYPFTTTLLTIAGIGLISAFYTFFIRKKGLEKAESDAISYRRPSRTSYLLHGRNRKGLLSRLYRQLITLGALLVLMFIAIILESPWLYIIAIAGILWVSVRTRKAMTCPHCGASLRKDLQKLDPSPGKTNWLIVVDRLSKGVKVTCSNCGRSLDD
ncbi:hypothetical protein [Thermodesulforhabdus norvegica]|uniref:DUF3592 domain-containing protein n=1 Tax=Thermodesulforhabdus norvegica TaxID=39841 RepID=A0A1I4UAK4_9BACT|nr:hypothetical protein [Thermodesulforhabdus norvegica]SFM86008.1 hypothetical protein SAMN05660836_01748 [Thermodesulforhabdus norvegica]